MSMTSPIACMTLPDAEEQQRLEESVGEQVEHRRDDRDLRDLPIPVPSAMNM